MFHDFRSVVIGMVLGLVVLSWSGAGRAAAEDLEWIQVSAKDPRQLCTATTHVPVRVVGVNYFGPHTGWAPKLWQRFDPAVVRKHLQLIHQQGFNTIRVFLTLESFHRQPGKISPEGMAKFRTLLQLCHEFQLYVIPTGPDHWEGLPDWIRFKDPLADDTVVHATEQWWTRFARQFRDEPVILAWDLLNEPAVRWNTAALKTKWTDWLRKKYRRVAAATDALGLSSQDVRSFDAIPIPPKNLKANDNRMVIYQQFRESIADAWTQRLVHAIRQSDSKHLITIGYIQWSSKVYLPNPSVYSGFQIGRNSQRLDFVTIHFYPLAVPRPCDGPEGITRNAAYLDKLLDECTRTDKPVVIGEFGWYGGGAIRRGTRVVMPEQSLSDQVAWNRKLLDVSRGRVCGWLNWAFADTPSSRDLTRWSGLWTENLELKPWGRQFAEFARARHDK